MVVSIIIMSNAEDFISEQNMTFIAIHLLETAHSGPVSSIFKVVRPKHQNSSEEQHPTPSKRSRMSSHSPSHGGPSGSSTGRRRRGNKQHGMSVAERLKQSQPVTSTKTKNGAVDKDEDEHEDLERFLQEDGIIDQKVERKMNFRDLHPFDQATMRLVAQYLDGMGFKGSVDKLIEESGLKIEDENATKIRECILNGKYDLAIYYIDDSTPVPLTTEEAEEAKFRLRLFQVASFIKTRQLAEAVYVLREVNEMVQNSEVSEHVKDRKIDILTAFSRELFSEEPRSGLAKIKDIRESQMKTLQSFLSTDFMLPADRLKSVLSYVHDSSSEEAVKLLKRNEDEKNGPKKKIRCVQVVEQHPSDVNVVKFSRDGQFLATGSRSNSVWIWKVYCGRIERLGKLDFQYEDDLQFIEWSSDNRFLAICGTQQCKYDLVVFNAATRKVFRTIRVPTGIEEMANRDHIGSHYTCCAFFAGKSTSRFRGGAELPSTKLIAANESGMMRVYNVEQPDGQMLLKTITGFRVRGVYGFKDGQRMLASDSHNRLRLYAIDSEREETIISEDSPIIAFTVHSSEQLVLTTTSLNLRLWDMSTRTLIRFFSGACQQDINNRYVIHASFGGVNQGFIATGSVGTNQGGHKNRSDGRVVIWNMDYCRPVYKLRGHTGCVNTVAWNPADPRMLVSGSDDKTVRVWQVDESLTDIASTVIPRRKTPTTALRQHGNLAPPKTQPRNWSQRMPEYSMPSTKPIIDRHYEEKMIEEALKNL